MNQVFHIVYEGAGDGAERGLPRARAYFYHEVEVYIYAYGHEARCMVQDQSFGLN